MVERARISELLGVDDQLALLAGLFTHAPVAFQIYDVSGHCLLVNDAFREMFGMPPSVLSQAKFSIVESPRSPQPVSESHALAARSTATAR